MTVLRRIEGYLRESGTTPSRFGRESVGDPRLVHDLRRGREPGRRTVERIDAYLASAPSRREHRPADPRRALLRGLARHLPAMAVERSSLTPWRSVTFTGARHELLVRLDGADGEAVAKAFADRADSLEIAMPGHIVADINVARAPGDFPRLRIEALTIEDC